MILSYINNYLLKVYLREDRASLEIRVIII